MGLEQSSPIAEHLNQTTPAQVLQNLSPGLLERKDNTNERRILPTYCRAIKVSWMISKGILLSNELYVQPHNPPLMGNAADDHCPKRISTRLRWA
ncbi:hypothetical protein TNCV_2793591 [Trichonephila clavipes]|nr:hypothetical protein TNCV_2793591 [Trichonephila clavipes]